MIFDAQHMVFLAVFALLTFGVPILVVWLSYSDNQFDVRSLWTHNERIDKLAVILMGTWWVHTCSMILLTLMQKVVAGDYITYMGWALPLIAKLFAPESPKTS